MNDPKKISINDYTYDLPAHRIAERPLGERDGSKLLLFKNGKISEDKYHNIATHIPGGSLLIFNDTKVVEARLLFQKTTGSIIEIFCLEPHEQYADITSAMLQQERVLWKCLVGGASKWKHGQLLQKTIAVAGDTIVVTAAYIEKRTDHFIIELSWTPASMSFAEVLHHAGAIPLPPYIKREADATDNERYQTVYAQHDGSVAAPTAGLHFTPAVFDQLAHANIKTDFVTLHVGAGTFKPVKAATMTDHEMHAEFIDVKKSLIENIIRQLDASVIAVGTTSLRTIETLYWLGVKISSGMLNAGDMPILTQWEPYELAENNIPVDHALQHLVAWMEKNKMEHLLAKTQIIIAPGYRFRIAKALVTNFHQPQSTLLLLVAAITNGKWKPIYQYALDNDFRFLSYGDGSLLWVDQD